MNTAHLSAAQVVPLRPTAAEALVPLCEALFFDAGKPLTPEQIADAIGSRPEAVRHALGELGHRLETEDRGLCLAPVGQAVQLVAKPVYRTAIEQLRHTDTSRLTAVVDEFLHARRQGGMRPRTQESYRLFLHRFVREVGKPVDEIQTRDVRLFLWWSRPKGGGSSFWRWSSSSIYAYSTSTETASPLSTASWTGNIPGARRRRLISR